MTEDNGARLPKSWDADMLMGKKSVEGVDIGESNRSNGLSPSSSRRTSFRFTSQQPETKDAFSLWGLPGHLTEEECAVYVSQTLGINLDGNLYCNGRKTNVIFL
jgi:hypothetical protein